MIPWEHVPLAQLITDTGVDLKRKPNSPEDNPVFLGPHPHKHESKSGTCLVVWSKAGTYYCLKCKAKGTHIEWLIDVGKVGDTFIETRQDAFDYLKKHYSPPPNEWRQPVPFPEFVGPPFPQSVLPESLERFVDEAAEDLQVPRDLMAGLGLSTASAVASDKARVQIKPGWLEPLNTYSYQILDTGEGKTPAMELATTPLEEIEKELVESSQDSIAQAQVEHDILESRLNALKKDAGKASTPDEERATLSEKAKELAVTFAQHRVPKAPRMLCSDVTSESLTSLLVENDGVMALMSDEGGILSTIMGRYSGGHLAVDVFQHAYSGKTPLRVDRKGRPPEFVPRPRLTMCLCIQPDVMRGLAAKPELRGLGFLARPLYIVPQSLVGYRRPDSPPISEQARTDYSNLIKNISDLDKDTDDDPHILKFSPDAKIQFDTYIRNLEPKLRPGGELREIRDWVHKLRGAVARISGIVHLIKTCEMVKPWDEPISGETMASAVRLGEYFTAHALVAFGLMGTSGQIKIAIDLWDAIRHRWSERFNRRDLHQALKHKYDVDEIQGGLNWLEEMGYVRQTAPTPSGEHGGRPRSPQYEVNPLAALPDNPPDGGFEGIEGFEPMLSEFEDIESTPSKTMSQDGTADSVTDISSQLEVNESADNDLESKDPYSEKLTPYSQNPQFPQNVPEYRYIVDADEAQKLVQTLTTEPVLGLDCETTGLDPIRDNIRLIQLSSPESTYIFDLHHVPLEVLAPVLQGGPVKIIHNAKFDCMFLYSAQGGVMPEPIFDTMLTDQVIHHRGYGRSLRDLADDYLDLELDKTEQTSDWDTEQLSPAQLAYAAQDAAVLLPLYDSIKRRVDELHLGDVVDLENRLVPAMCWMEGSGVHFDQERWDALVVEVKASVDALTQELDQIVTAELGVDDMLGRKPYTVNWNSTAQVLESFRRSGLWLRTPVRRRWNP